jgi:hypothetical protein
MEVQWTPREKSSHSGDPNNSCVEWSRTIGLPTAKARVRIFDSKDPDPGTYVELPAASWHGLLDLIRPAGLP